MRETRGFQLNCHSHEKQTKLLPYLQTNKSEECLSTITMNFVMRVVITSHATNALISICTNTHPSRLHPHTHPKLVTKYTYLRSVQIRTNQTSNPTFKSAQFTDTLKYQTFTYVNASSTFTIKRLFQTFAGTLTYQTSEAYICICVICKHIRVLDMHIHT